MLQDIPFRAMCSHARRNSLERLRAFWLLVGSLVFLSLTGGPSFAGTQQVDGRVDFTTQIAPIFAEHCFECHGDDTREGGLRLTNAKDALAECDSGLTAIVPGKADSSELLKRVMSQDESERMPPEAPGLTDLQIRQLKRWIDQGAPWPAEDRKKHWAYIKPVRPQPPTSRWESWVRNDIDRFVAARLETALENQAAMPNSKPDGLAVNVLRAGSLESSRSNVPVRQALAPAKPAEPARLIRRVSMALTGLPPSAEQVAAFVANPGDQAYEQFVDQCLASPAYGERWAQPWLDLARYADSNGYQADQLRESWAFRDWVIDSINRDQPFDQFAIEQLAGDLLPAATQEQKIATGFHRTVTCNVEAGVHPEENRVNQIFDRVNTTGTAFLGTTLECCQCHNHKYDPFSQDEYYQLFAYFNNTPLEVKLNSGVQYDFVGPKMDLPLESSQRDQRDRLRAEIARVKQELADLEKDPASRQEALAKLELDARGGVRWLPLTVSNVATSGDESIHVLHDQSVLLGGSLPETSVYTIEALTRLSQITAFKIEALTHPTLPGTGPGRGDEVRSNFVLNEFSTQVVLGAETEPIEFKESFADFSQADWAVEAAIDGDRKTGWAIAPKFHQPHWAIFVCDQAPYLESNQSPQPLRKFRFTLDQNYGQGRTMGRVRILATDSAPSVLALPNPIVRALQSKRRTPAQVKLLDQFMKNHDPAYQQLTYRLSQLEKELASIQPSTTLVMVEMEAPRPTRKLVRGEYLNPGKSVQPGVPSVLNPLDSSLPANRLGLARWMANSENPLFARVAVNRWWSAFFGTGLLASEEDFGTQSDPPSHPQLLDWLATELVAQGWSRKAIHKRIVMSATFRQSSRVRAEQLELDPGNRFLARGPRVRMTAEMIRDHALSVSGLLSSQMHGPAIMPYQPSNIWKSVGRNAPRWKEQLDENRLRRGIYVIWRRAAPYPSFVNFDAPDRATCVAKRPSTNTPLQALTLLNDQAFLEMALALATKVTRDLPQASPKERIEQAMRRCVSRDPTAVELQTLNKLYQAERARFEKAKTLAKFAKNFAQLRKAQVHPLLNAELDADLATLTTIANVLLNLDESIHF